MPALPLRNAVLAAAAATAGVVTAATAGVLAAATAGVVAAVLPWLGLAWRGGGATSWRALEATAAEVFAVTMRLLPLPAVAAAAETGLSVPAGSLPGGGVGERAAAAEGAGGTSVGLWPVLATCCCCCCWGGAASSCGSSVPGVPVVIIVAWVTAAAATALAALRLSSVLKGWERSLLAESKQAF